MPNREPEVVYNNLGVEVLNADSDEDVDKYNARLILVMSIVFLIFWFPFYALRTYYEIDSGSMTFSLLISQAYAYVLGYFKSVVSPIATILFYPESRYFINKFRESVKIILTK